MSAQSAIEPAAFLESTRRALLASPEWQQLAAQLHTRLQSVLADDHMTSFFSELTPAEQHAYVQKVEASMPHMPAHAPFMRALSAHVDQRLWTRSLAQERRVQQEQRAQALQRQHQQQLRNGGDGDDDLDDSFSGIVDFASPMRGGGGGGDNSTAKSSSSIPMFHFASPQSALAAGSAAGAAARGARRRDSSSARSVTHSAAGSAFGGSAYGSSAYGSGSAIGGGGVLSQQFKTEAQRRAEAEALVAAAAAEALVGGTFEPPPPTTHEAVMSTSIACLAHLLRSLPAARLADFTNENTLRVLQNQRVPVALRVELWRVCLSSAAARAGYWSLLRSSQLATISERDPWIVEQCDRVLSEHFADWPIGAEATAQGAGASATAAGADAASSATSSSSSSFGAAAASHAAQRPSRAHDNDSLAILKTAISYVDVCRSLEALPVDNEAVFFLVVPLLRTMQCAPEFSAAALDTVAALVEHLLALLDKDAAPYSRRRVAHSAFCARLLRLLHTVDIEVYHALVRVAQIPDRALPPVGASTATIDFDALVAAAMRVAAPALPTIGENASADTQSQHGNGSSAALPPLALALLEVTDFLMLRACTPEAALFVWDQLVISNFALLDHMAAAVLVCARDRVMRCATAADVRRVLCERQMHTSNGAAAGGVSLRRVQDTVARHFHSKPQLLYRVGVHAPLVASLSAAAVVGGGGGGGGTNPTASGTAAAATGKPRPLSINLIAPDANTPIALATAKHSNASPAASSVASPNAFLDSMRRAPISPSGGDGFATSPSAAASPLNVSTSDTGASASVGAEAGLVAAHATVAMVDAIRTVFFGR